MLGAQKLLRMCCTPSVRRRYHGMGQEKNLRKVGRYPYRSIHLVLLVAKHGPRVRVTGYCSNRFKQNDNGKFVLYKMSTYNDVKEIITVSSKMNTRTSHLQKVAL